jgi:hypothetical protein
MHVDDASRRSWSRQLKSKSDALAVFQLLRAQLERDRWPWKLAYVQTDSESIYTSTDFKDYENNPATAL